MSAPIRRLRRLRRRGAAWAPLLGLALGAPGALAQDAPKRLSDALLEAAPRADAYPLGASWNVPSEAVSQRALQQSLLDELAAVERQSAADAAAARRLRDWIGAMAPTGRVPLALADARWLQAHPSRDPVLQPGQSVVLPARPSSVTVVDGRGERCAVQHAPQRRVDAYVAACAVPGPVDWAWIAQPDGRLQRHGIAAWNRSAQDEPAPGAWIWVPARHDRWSDDFSERLLRWLATQGPAADPATVAPAPPASVAAPARDLPLSAGDWGGIGLLQTPTARMAPAGAFRFSVSRTEPYTRGNVFFQPLDFLEAGFRYVAVTNRPYGPPELSGTQSYKDKGFDVKLRLWRESAWLPEVALGLRDFSGKALFSGEYLVASKRFGDLDASLGLAWGYGAGRGSAREGDAGGLKSYFKGRPALFGGVQWHTPWTPLTIKLEVDANDYQHEPSASWQKGLIQPNNQRRDSRFNIGAVYRIAPSLDVSLGVERGNTVAFGLTLQTQLDELQTPKLSDPRTVAVGASRPALAPDWEATGRDVERQTGWHVRRIEQRERELHLAVDVATATYWRERLDRALAVLHRDAPSGIDRFVVDYRDSGLGVVQHVVERDGWVAQQTRLLPPAERRPVVAARPYDGASAGTRLRQNPLPRFETHLGFDFRQTLGGPDAFLLFQFSALQSAKLRLRDDTWLLADVRLALLDNYDKFKYTAASDLPRVRTFLREYLTTSKLTLPNLQLRHVGNVGANHHYTLYAGYLEEMFGGAGAEWLVRPVGSRLAFGIDVNAVKQRDFRQNFAFRDYKVATGHATLYWDTGWNDVQARVSAGRYLAKDVGATVEVSRVFRNGVAVGAFATKTNVSAERFGEGGFDKGIFVSIPFDALLTRSSDSTAFFLWRPLTRDGGARLSHGPTLYDLTQGRDPRALEFQPAPRPNDESPPADRRERGIPDSLR